MNPKVDTGEIIGVKRFPMSGNETVETLSRKTYKILPLLFEQIINYIVKNDSLPESLETWKRIPYKRTELEELATIDTGMSKKEIEKRIRATFYKGKPAPFIELYGYRFEFDPER